MLEGIAAIHKAAPRLMHRDLKPANILKLTDGTLKIFDLGFSKICSKESLKQSVCGSPLFMAPELFTTFVYDERMDSYSIYTILFKMSVGGYPINARNIFEFSKNVTFAIEQNQGPSKDKRLTSLEPQLRSLIISLGRLNYKERATVEEALNHPALKSEE